MSLLLHRSRMAGCLALALGLISTSVARAGLLFITNTTGNTIGEYTDSGVPVNPSLITGLHGPVGIAISGSNLFVANSGNGTIGEYTTSGAAVNAALISGISGPVGIALSGSNLFVASGGSGNGKIGEYDATTGTPINAALITGLSAPYGVAVSGSELYLTNGGTSQAGGFNLSPLTLNLLISGLDLPDGIAQSGSNLFVANACSGIPGPTCGMGTIGEYDATTGVPINAALVSGLSWPVGIALSGSHLFVANSTGNTIGEYDAITGAPINAALITGLNNPQGIAILSAVPEPSGLALLSTALLGIGIARCRSRFT